MNSSGFDPYADAYRDIHNRNVRFTGGSSDYYSEYKVRIMAQTYRPPASACRILDFGCGDGLGTHYLTRYFPEARVCGIDVSEKSLEAARRRVPVKATFVRYGGGEIPFPDNDFDLVLISGVIHHIACASRPALLKSLFRVCAPQASVYIFENNPLNPFTRYIVATCEFDRDACLLTSGRLKRDLRAAGFEIQRCRFTLLFPRHKLFRPLHRLEERLGALPLGGQYYVRAVKGRACSD